MLLLLWYIIHSSLNNEKKKARIIKLKSNSMCLGSWLTFRCIWWIKRYPVVPILWDLRMKDRLCCAGPPSVPLEVFFIISSNQVLNDILNFDLPDLRNFICRMMLHGCSWYHSKAFKNSVKLSGMSSYIQSECNF